MISLLFTFLIFSCLGILVINGIDLGVSVNASLIKIIVFLISLLFIFPVLKIYFNFIDGDMGEQLVKHELYQLSEKGFYFLSDLKIGERGNIDAVVIGPTGIWTIEVKNYKRRVIKEEKIQRELSQAYAESKILSKTLIEMDVSLPVKPVLVFTNKKTRLNFGMSPVRGVYVINLLWLKDLLTKHSSGYLDDKKCIEIKDKLTQFSSILN